MLGLRCCCCVFHRIYLGICLNYQKKSLLFFSAATSKNTTYVIIHVAKHLLLLLANSLLIFGHICGRFDLRVLSIYERRQFPMDDMGQLLVLHWNDSLYITKILMKRAFKPMPKIHPYTKQDS